MLAYALNAFAQAPQIESIWVGVSPGFIDHPILKEFSNLGKPIHFLPTGGPTRQETVRNTLAALMSSGVVFLNHYNSHPTVMDFLNLHDQSGVKLQV